MGDTLVLNLSKWTPSDDQVLKGDYLFQVQKGGKMVETGGGTGSQGVWPVKVVASLPGGESEIGKLTSHRTNTTAEYIGITMDFIRDMDPEGFKAFLNEIGKTKRLDFDSFAGKLFGGSVAPNTYERKDRKSGQLTGELVTNMRISRTYPKAVFDEKLAEAQNPAPDSIFKTGATAVPQTDDEDEEV